MFFGMKHQQSLKNPKRKGSRNSLAALNLNSKLTLSPEANGKQEEQDFATDREGGKPVTAVAPQQVKPRIPSLKLKNGSYNNLMQNKVQSARHARNGNPTNADGGEVDPDSN